MVKIVVQIKKLEKLVARYEDLLWSLHAKYVNYRHKDAMSKLKLAADIMNIDCDKLGEILMVENKIYHDEDGHLHVGSDVPEGASSIDLGYGDEYKDEFLKIKKDG